MQLIRRAQERGHADFGWLDSRHTFSFGRYHDPRHMGFGVLRVINEDRVQPGRGFDTHGHQDMEIVSYVLEGALAHRDSTGTGSVIKPGDVQRMSAGTGIRHSEFNDSEVEPVHFLQIWILPERDGLEPGYQEQHFAADGRAGRWQLLASAGGREDSVTIHQDLDLSVAVLSEGDRLSQSLQPDRQAWLQVARGTLDLNGQRLNAGDGMAIRDESTLELCGTGTAEVLWFDMQRE